MAEFTPNFNLKKPMKDEFYNIEDFNGNMDIIDEALKNAGQSEQLESDVTEIKNDIGSPSDISSSPTIFGKLAEIKETLTTKFSEIISKITSTDSKIGTTTDTGGTSSAGGIFAKLNKLLTDWTTTRASRIDSIYKNTTTNNTASTTGTLSQKLSSIISTISSILTDTNSTDSKIGTTTDTGGTSSAGSVFGKLNKLLTDWTSTRASRVDTIYNNTLTSSTSSSTGTLSQKLNYIKSLIGTNSDSGSTTLFGLIKTLSSKGTIKSVQYGELSFNSSSMTVALNAIKPEKSVVLINGEVRYESSSMAGITSNPHVSALTSTELKLSLGRTVYGAAGDKVSWQVIEFI